MATRAAMSIDRFGEYAASTAPAPETVSSLKAKVARLMKRISILESELQTARTQRDLAAAVEQDDTALNREQRQRQQEAARNRELSAKLEAANKSLADSIAAQQRAELAAESVGKLREQLVREERAREQADSDARRLRDELQSNQKPTSEADAIVQLRAALAAEMVQTEKLRERELKLQRELATITARTAKGMDTLQLTRDAQSRRREEENTSTALREENVVRGQAEMELLRGELWCAETGLQQAQAAAEALGNKAEELITRLIEQQDQSREKAAQPTAAAPPAATHRPRSSTLQKQYPTIPGRINELSRPALKNSGSVSAIHAVSEALKPLSKAELAILSAHNTIKRTNASKDAQAAISKLKR